jgi:Zn-dependent metalloprotease
MSSFRPLNLCLFFALPWVPFQAAEPDHAETALIQRLLDQRGELGLREADGFQVKDVETDPDGTRHVRLQQRYRGLRVWGGQAVLHLDPNGVESPMTNALVRGVQVEVTPNLDQAEALAITHATEAPRGSYARPPTVELLVYPAATLQRSAGSGEGRNAMDFAPRITRLHLAYHIHLELQNGSPETRHDDYLVDAHTGAILRKWSTLFTFKTPGVPADTTGKSQYSGDVQLGSLAASCGYVMADPTRQNISTRDLAGGTDGHGVLYVSRDGQWGDGQNYDPGRGSKSPNGQTAAVDAHYGLQTTWDFYRHVLGRNGIDGKGTAAYNRVH